MPRLINQVCDHVLLLAYAAGIRRIEPAHVEEAWADLQQLPTPWNAHRRAERRRRDRIRRPGRQSLGIASHRGQDRGGRGQAQPTARGPASPVMQPTLVAETAEDPETFEQLRHIQKLLADVQAEFQPAATSGPEVELVFEAPHPFAETVRGRRSDCRSLRRRGPGGRAECSCAGGCRGQQEHHGGAR